MRWKRRRNALLILEIQFVPAKSGKTFQLINPATEEPSVQVSEAGKEDVDAAVQYAKGAWEEWFAKDGMEIYFQDK